MHSRNNKTMNKKSPTFKELTVNPSAKEVGPLKYSCILVSSSILMPPVLPAEVAFNVPLELNWKQ